MKKIIYTIVLFLGVFTWSFSQEAVEKNVPPSGNALVGDYYGADVSNVITSNAISVEKLEGKFANQKKLENVAVKGIVTDVCEKRGCWLTIKTENGSSFFVKMKDYAFFVPIALKGKNVVLEGDAEKKITPVDELKHYAKDAKKSQVEINTITAPKEEIRFVANGIKVVN
ncbi:DUF4920 domain-containing protein [Flavobacterium daemonense]|uniref:DUF4920 domain-containing protein n=1 Tax=Flavobacterium daemonense TaxID=1393049 RepID=UPI001185BC5B|nr:DUF4920 domain-containing protein [Flavobacterium daemonense]KAF2326872.1 DUF4920 domain-containing protein [Flavobacterium daemonense]